MKSKFQFIEPLEARIAPALLVNGGNLLGGVGNPTTGETSTGANSATLVKVISGQALVFYDNGTITGISVGQHTKLDITGDVVGDIITNLGPNGRLTDSDGNPSNGEDGNLLTGYGIKAITTHPFGDGEKGSIGRIIAGGAIKNINVSGEVAGIYAGDGVFRTADTVISTTGTVDFNTVHPGLDNVFTFAKGASQPNGNASITNVTINTARQLEIFTGSGQGSDQGPGLQGSDITNVTITKTLSSEGNQPVVFLHAGDGGSGADGGGRGGSITSFNDQGSISYVKLQTGNGGDGGGGNGGDGGFLTKSTIVSSSTRYDFLMGNGGSGQKGGLGGGMDTVSFTNNITGGKSLIATADFNGDGLSDVILLNTITGEATVSLGTTTAPFAGEANFQVVKNQLVPQADGTTIQTPFLPTEGANPTSLVVADLNGDGALDFAVSYASTNSLGIYTNTGHHDGTFTASQVSLGFSPTRLVTGDFGGTGHTDLAIVSASVTRTGQFGSTSQVYVAHNDGAGHLTIDTAAAATLPGIATDAAATQAYDAAGTLVGADLFVGSKTGSVYPVQFRGGTATIGASLAAFGENRVPVNSVDVVNNGTTESVLAFSKDVNAIRESAGDNSVAPQAQVSVFTLDSAGRQTGAKTFQPDATSTAAHFLAGTNVVGTVAPGAVSLWSITGLTQQYTVSTSLASDGNLLDFAATNLNGVYQFAASGAANNRFYFTAGNPSSADGVAPLLASDTTFRPRVISLVTGNGGDGDSLAGGTGGSVKAFTYTQTLGSGVIQAGGNYTTSLVTGHGGNSNGGTGGKGGGVRKSSITMTPGYLTINDDTTTAFFQTGAGGQGATGGDGGSLKKVAFTSVFSEISGTSVNIDSVAVRMFTGNGGAGTSGAGGGGGNIQLAGQSSISGVSFVDDDSAQADQAALLVKAGDGGQGVTAGGAGGSLTNVGSQNVSIAGTGVVQFTQLDSAQVSSGNGGLATDGNGGAGGNVTGTNVTAGRVIPTVFIAGNPYSHDAAKFGIYGSVTTTAGTGGAGRGGVGGAGGSINQSTVGSVRGDAGKGYGALVEAGAGGNGDFGGGQGGSVMDLNMSSPQDSSLYAAVIAAGNGGNALSSGAGGAGGGIQGIKQTKDVNSAINVIQAGNGGLGAGGVGGVGGSVTGVNTAGFIGVPSSNFSAQYYGAFHGTGSTPAAIAAMFAGGQIPQGVFAGQGADGADNGSVMNVVARQIAAIGASVQANGTFAAAHTVDGITADLIGYDVGQDGTFQSAGGQRVSPSSSTPLDGFILGSEVSNINTLDNGRTGQFTFTS